MRVESEVRTPAALFPIDRDRVPPVVAGATRRRERDEDVGRRRSPEGELRLAGRSAAEERALDAAREERVERARAGDGRARARDGEPDRALLRRFLEVDRVHDPYPR